MCPTVRHRMEPARSFRWAGAIRAGRGFFLAALGFASGVAAVEAGDDVRVSGAQASGIASVGELVKFKIRVENRGESSLVVTDVTTSCPCTRAVRTDHLIEGGQSGEILMEYKPDAAGKSSVEISIHTDRESQDPLHFLFQGMALPVRKAAVGGAAFVSATELEDMVEAGRALVLDVRPPGAFASFRIQGAVNVPLEMLPRFRTEAGREVVVCGAGLDDPALAGGLPQKARILRGGMRGWVQSGRRVEGPGAGSALYSGMIPFSGLADADLSSWKLVHVSGRSEPDSFPLALREMDVVKPSEMKGYFHRLAGGSPDASPVLVLGDEGVASPADVRELEATGRPVFQLEGGIRAYRSAMSARATVLNRGVMTLSSGGASAAGAVGIAGKANPCVPCEKNAAKAAGAVSGK